MTDYSNYTLLQAHTGHHCDMVHNCLVHLRVWIVFMQEARADCLHVQEARADCLHVQEAPLLKDGGRC